MTELYENERIDEVNDSLRLIQKKGGLTFGTDALLLAGYANSRDASGLELGGGSGIISMLMLTRGKLAHARVLEVQPEYAKLAARNAELNNLSERLLSENIDIRDFKAHESYDTVYSNPPYMTVASGKSNELEKKNLARHEVMGNILDFCKCAKRSLKYGGSFLVVYRPDRLTDLLAAMRECALEPKRMTFVHADTKSEASMVLIEARLGGKCGLKLTAPLLIYKDAEHSEYTDEMNYIMENGSFPSIFKRT